MRRFETLFCMLSMDDKSYIEDYILTLQKMSGTSHAVSEVHIFKASSLYASMHQNEKVHPGIYDLEMKKKKKKKDIFTKHLCPLALRCFPLHAEILSGTSV